VNERDERTDITIAIHAPVDVDVERWESNGTEGLTMTIGDRLRIAIFNEAISQVGWDLQMKLTNALKGKASG
jgi:hypothetical protein